MKKNRHLSRSISDACFGEIRRQLSYKSKVLTVCRFFPSSQLCSVCGFRNERVKDLSIRTWVCPECNSYHNRDVNAAQNIVREALAEFKSVDRQTSALRAVGLKQEVESYCLTT
jgi:putative transposase